MNAIAVSVDQTRCSRFRCVKSACEECARVCPVNAVDFSAGGARIGDACVQCGACVAACPTGAARPAGSNGAPTNGAFDPARATDRQWGERFRQIAAGGAGRITCVHGDRDAQHVMCLGRMTEGMLLEVAICGAAPSGGGDASLRHRIPASGCDTIRGVEILKPDCAACPWERAGRAFDRALGRARRLMAWMGIPAERLSVTPVPYGAEPVEIPAPETSRRTFVAAVLGKAADAVIPDALTDGPDGKDGAQGAKFREEIARRSPNPKRAHLLEIIQSHSRESGNPACLTIGLDSRFPGNDGHKAGTADETSRPLTARIEVSPSCMGCNVCEALCPEKAIRRVETADKFELHFNPAACTACGVCVDACFPRAISLRATDDPADLTVPVYKLFEAPRQICKACGAPFLMKKSGGDKYCPLCMNQERKRLAVARGWMAAR